MKHDGLLIAFDGYSFGERWRWGLSGTTMRTFEAAGFGMEKSVLARTDGD